jgi:hypothetical protein
MAWLRDLFRPQPKGLAAAAVSSTRGQFDSSETRRADRRISEAWDIYRLVGEVHYATQQQARLVGRLKWFMSVNGSEPDENLTDQIFRAAFGSPAEIRDLQVKAAIHLQVAGGYYFARVGGPAGKWEILPNPLDTKAKKKLDRADVTVLVENPDPRDPDARLDSPVLAALDIARELLLARGQARAMARSRTAQLNTLIYPIEGAGQDPKQFEQDLIDVMVAPLADEMSTSSVVPNLIGFPAEYIKEIKSISLTGELDDKIHERIDRLIRQLAVILDIPIEILLGMGDTNHWGAWLVQEDNWLNHVEPLSSPIGEGFAQALEQALDNETDIEITPDPAGLLRRRPTISDALKAAELGITDEEWALEQLGATPENAGPGLLAMQAAKAEARRIPDAAPASAEPAAVAAARTEPIAIESSPAPSAPSSVNVERLAGLDVEFSEAMQDLLADAGDRALERLGARLRSVAQGGKIELPDIPNQQVAIAYGPEIPNQDENVADTARKFEPQFERFVSRAFRKIKLAGLALDPHPSEVNDAFAAFQAEVAKIVVARRGGAPGNAEAWLGAKRVMALLGGNPDPQVQPIVSASGVQTAPRGIALGIRAIEIMNADYGLVADEWIWHHAYSGPSPHPVHLSLAGRSVRPGGTILEGGSNFYPGDHAGCQCLVVPVLRRNR